MIRCKLIERSVVGTTQGATHVGRSVSGETLTMGRGASCKIYLPDPAIRLDHATIHRAEDGFLYLEAHGPVFVDQKPQTTCRLEVGQTLVLGPYHFQLDALEAGPGVAVVDMVLLYSVDESASTSGPSLADQLQAAKRPGFFRRRWLAWVLTTLVVVWGGLLPLWTAYHPPEKSAEVGPEKNVQRARAADVFWNPGQIASAHQSVGNDCRQCHEKPFERVKDASCQSCHTTVGGHAAHPGMDEAAFNNQRCASCHKEHQGVDGMKKVDAMGCVQCHGDITQFAPKSQLENIADFKDSHPGFKLSLRTMGEAPGTTQVVRVLQTPGLKNPTGLKFPHDIHTSKAGIKSPKGPVSSQGRVVLECKSCHEQDAAGVRFVPIKMEQHCQECHRLSVDPQMPERQLPHVAPPKLAIAVKDVYASLALERYPARLVVENSLLVRPGSSAAPNVLTSSERWVEQQTQDAMDAMLQKPKGVCTTCHEVSLQTAAKLSAKAWAIAPITFTQHWLPKSDFSHAQHKNAACRDCHATDVSKSAEDVLVPDIKVCQTCHTGAHSEGSKVVSSCDSCHGFHVKLEHPVFKAVKRADGASP